MRGAGVTSDTRTHFNPAKHHVRWRSIAAWILTGMGGLMLLVSLPTLIDHIFLLLRHGPAAFEALNLALPGVGLYLACALLLMTAGRLLKTQRWGWMTLILLIAFAANVSGSMLMEADEARRNANSIAPVVPDRFSTAPANSRDHH
jgi:hypothetical protein